MIHHLCPAVGPDWWELTDEDRQLWLARGPRGFLQDRRAAYLIEASTIKSRGTASTNARKRARLMRLAEEIAEAVDLASYSTEDKKVGDRWVLYIRIHRLR